MEQAYLKSNFGPGITASFVLHVVLGLFVVFVLERARDNQPPIQQVFSVTLEGGANLGSISQAPKEGAKKILTPESKEAEPDPTPAAETPPPIKEIKAPSIVEEDKAAKLKLEAEKKKAEEAKKKAELDKKKEEEKKIEDKKKAEQEKKDKVKEKQERDKKLQEALQKLKEKYEGESASAGGKGFGAAVQGGQGMGGGTLTSIEKLAYSNRLQAHVKQGWRWLNSSQRLIAKIQANLGPDGAILESRIIQSSGNSNFDDSVIRAVEKASPVPPPPTDLYPEFKVVVFTFDSAE